MIADYELIRRDFKHTRALSETEIDAWLIENFAYIAQSQTLQQEVNSPITIDTKAPSRVAVRPYQYNRALVLEDAISHQLIDIKGVGAPHPQQKSHQNGLMTGGEALREYMYEKLVQTIFTHHQKRFAKDKKQTIGSYAVLDLGFDVKLPQDQGLITAGAILRQPHDRAGNLDQKRLRLKSVLLDHSPSKNEYNFLEAQQASEIESILRRYGITSAGVTIHDSFDVANIQGNKKGAIVDFGGFLRKKSFKRVDLDFLGTDGSCNLDPKSPSFPQVLKPLLVPDAWGVPSDKTMHPRNDGPRVYANEMAKKFRSGEITSVSLKRDIEKKFFKPLKEKLEKEQEEKWFIEFDTLFK